MSNLPPIPPDQIGENTPWRNWFTSVRQNIAQTYLTPINNTNSTTDLSLGVGQSAYLTFTSATSMPLYIACGDGQIYEISMAGTYTAAAGAGDTILQPNNAVPTTNSFTGRGLYVSNTAVTPYNGAINLNGFDLSAGGASILEGKFTLFTSTRNKKIIVDSASTTSAASLKTNWAVEWNDTTTPYSSIGTIIMPNAWTGTITIRRIA